MSRYKRKNITKNNFGFLPPPKTDGHLYYVRLRTEIGLIYKIGYTTLPSVEERLSFNGEGEEKLLDKIIFFHHFPNAWELEQELHSLFEKNKLFPCGSYMYMPFYKNGQSELYGQDVLEIDYEFTLQQYEDVKDNIAIRNITWTGERDEKEVRAEVEKRRSDEKARAEEKTRSQAAYAAYKPGSAIKLLIILLKSMIPIFWSINLVLGFLLKNKPKNSDYKIERIDELRNELKDLLRIQRAKKLIAIEAKSKIMHTSNIKSL